MLSACLMRKLNNWIISVSPIFFFFRCSLSQHQLPPSMVTVPNRSNLWHLHLSRLLYSCCAIHHARSSSVSSPLLWVAIVTATFRLPRHLAASPTRLFHLLLLTLVWCLQMLSISSIDWTHLSLPASPWSVTITSLLCWRNPSSLCPQLHRRSSWSSPSPVTLIYSASSTRKAFLVFLGWPEVAAAWLHLHHRWRLLSSQLVPSFTSEAIIPLPVASIAPSALVTADVWFGRLL